MSWCMMSNKKPEQEVKFNEISLLNDHPEIQSDLEKVFNGNRAADKCLALTAIAADKFCFANNVVGK